MNHSEALKFLDRAEAEYGGELPDLSDPTPRERAMRLLNADDADFEDADMDMLQQIVNGEMDE